LFLDWIFEFDQISGKLSDSFCQFETSHFVIIQLPTEALFINMDFLYFSKEIDNFFFLK